MSFRISSLTDIRTYLANTRGDLESVCGPTAIGVAAEALRSSVHPAWGSDWEPWLDDHQHLIDESVAHLPEGVVELPPGTRRG
jgi:hypothetical protein